MYPKEIEDEIDALPGVVEIAVIGLPHADFGEGVTAIVVRAKGAMIDETTVQAALESRLAKFKLPKRVIFVDELPRNTMGKVQKNVLRETYRDLYASRGSRPGCRSGANRDRPLRWQPHPHPLARSDPEPRMGACEQFEAPAEVDRIFGDLTEMTRPLTPDRR